MAIDAVSLKPESIPTGTVLNIYERILRIRRFEEQVGKLFAQGKIPGLVHLYIGAEAVAAGVCATLRDDDYIISTHRGHGHVIGGVSAHRHVSTDESAVESGSRFGT